MPTSRAANTFSGGDLDRAAERRRDTAWLRGAEQDPASRAVLVTGEGVAVTGGDDPRAALVPLADTAGERVLLGVSGGRAVFAAEQPAGTVPHGARLAGLREVASALPPADAALLAYGQAMAAWHRRTRFCGICGRPTTSGDGGHVRTCAEGHQHHPRTDAVVIMLVTDGDRTLLGRQAAWPARRYSALAGFVEPGESLEEAVRREVAEEAGVTVGAVRYCSSQPWPFPMNLMMGFHAEWAGGEPEARDRELEDVRWFSRDEVAAAVARSEGWEDAGGAGGRLLLPPREAIARRLIEDWLGAR